MSDESRYSAGESSAVTGQDALRGAGLRRCSCGIWFRPKKWNQRFCHSKEADEAYNRANPVTRQRPLPFTPAPEPLIQPRDQRVPKTERGPLCRMSRTILARLRQGEALASELQAMFPGARSVRTRISDVNLWLQDRSEKVSSAPVAGMVGEWRYWIEGVR